MIEVQRLPPATLVRLNRPDVLNALSFGMLDALAAELTPLDRDKEIRAIVLTGSDTGSLRVDVSELAVTQPGELLRWGIECWEAIRNICTPMIAAVRSPFTSS